VTAPIIEPTTALLQNRPGRLIAVSIAFALAGCGGGGGGGTPTITPSVSAAGVQQWRIGFVQWRRSMTHAINDLSVLFSEQDTVRAIAAGNTKLVTRLFAAERVLAACSSKLRALGVTPSGYEDTRAEALLACKRLEKGAATLVADVKRLRSGHGVDLFDQLSGPLGDGQALIRQSRVDFRQAATG
jgi:hypothetical protein